MVPEPSLIVLLLLLGAWVGVDSTTVGQFMISRPVVSATLAGWFAGDPAAGALVGLILEALNLTVLPVGAARYPEIGPAAVVAGATYALGPQDGGSLLAVIVFSIAWAWIAGLTVRYMRQFNRRIVAPGHTSAEGQVPAAWSVERRHLASIGLDVGRGTLLVALGFPTLALFQQYAWRGWMLPDAVTSVVVWSIVMACVAATVRLFGGHRLRLLVIGIALGAVLVALT